MNDQMQIVEITLPLWRLQFQVKDSEMYNYFHSFQS